MARVSVEVRRNQRRTTYRVRYSPPGSREQITEGNYSRRLDADRAAAKLRVALETGEWFDGAPGRAMTFERWVDEWSERAQHRRTSTADRDRYVLEVHWLPRFGSKPLAGITPFEVTGAVAELRRGVDGRKGLAESTIRTNVEVLSRCLAAAVEHRLLASNPCTVVKLRRTPQRSEDIRFLSVDELSALVAATPAEYRAAMVLGGVMGLRWSEVVGLRAGRVDMLRRQLHVVETTSESIDHVLRHREEVKSAAGRRTLPMPDDVLSSLAEHMALTGRREPDDLLILDHHGETPLRSAFRRSVLQRATKAAGIDGLTFHGLRHSCAGFLIEAGTHPEIIRKWMGHSDIRTTLALYGRVSDENFTATASALQGVLGPAPAVEVAQ